MKPILATVAILAAAQFTGLAQAGAPKQHSKPCPGLAPAITFYREAAWRWQDQRDAPRIRSGHAERSRSCAYKRWAATRWQDLAYVERGLFDAWLIRMLGHDGRSGKWGCIHRHEGAWNASNAPYGGGLQMDAGFQRTYGSEFGRRFGWASNWPPWAQLIAAERAYFGYHRYAARHYGPWPNTSRACGF